MPSSTPLRQEERVSLFSLSLLLLRLVVLSSCIFSNNGASHSRPPTTRPRPTRPDGEARAADVRDPNGPLLMLVLSLLMHSPDEWRRHKRRMLASLLDLADACMEAPGSASLRPSRAAAAAAALATVPSFALSPPAQQEAQAAIGASTGGDNGGERQSAERTAHGAWDFGLCAVPS